MKKLLIIILLFSCSRPFEEAKPELNGTFKSDGIELIFSDGNLTGNTDCNSLNGNYSIVGNEIQINIKGTKVGCEDEFDIKYLRESYKFELIDDKLILSGLDFELIFYAL